MPFLSEILKSIAEKGRSLGDLAIASRRKPAIEEIEDLSRHLLSNIGEATELATATEILDLYRTLDEAGKLVFFRLLLEQFGPDVERLRKALGSYARSPDIVTVNGLHAASEPLRQTLLRRLNQVFDGTSSLMAMRADLLHAVREAPELAIVDDDFSHLFSSWFNRGFLELRRIDWQTPAAILEKIIRYEAVHEISDWEELRERIDPPDRRLYAFFHPRVHDEPLIFVEVALMQSMPAGIDEVLGSDRRMTGAADAATAVFYSISDCQQGLRGISFGNFLIKQVVEELQRELPHIRQFVTLSPVRGLSNWIGGLRGSQSLEANPKLARILDQLDRLLVGEWWESEDTAAPVGKILMPLAANYLLNAKDRNGQVMDPVARFHLRNGARLERINWLGDPGKAGLQSAHGIMVNYLYKRDEIEQNHENFVMRGGINASASVRRLAQAELMPAELAET